MKSGATTGSGPTRPHSSAATCGRPTTRQPCLSWKTILTGSGQNIGLLEYYGYDIADLNTYYANAKQTNLSSKVTGISTDGTEPDVPLYTQGRRL